jgi:hypothetical protein
MRSAFQKKCLAAKSSDGRLQSGLPDECVPSFCSDPSLKQLECRYSTLYIIVDCIWRPCAAALTQSIIARSKGITKKLACIHDAPGRPSCCCCMRSDQPPSRPRSPIENYSSGRSCLVLVSKYLNVFKSSLLHRFLLKTVL